MQVQNIFKRIILSDGHSMPMFGLGSFTMQDGEVEKAVHAAVKLGYRLFDTAHRYGNEEALGRALKTCGLKRTEYFVVTKLMAENNGYESAKYNLRNALKRLQLDYVDLFLIHTPRCGENVETWKAFCELKRDGLTKSIGVSNFNVSFLKGLLTTSLECPVVNQIELHPWHQQPEVYEFCLRHNITVMGYCPLARCRLFGPGCSPLIEKLSEKYRKTKPQILLRWSLQNGVITIPKSSNPERLKENANIYDFHLTEDEMKEMKELDDNIYISVANPVMERTWNG